VPLFLRASSLPNVVPSVLRRSWTVALPLLFVRSKRGPAELNGGAWTMDVQVPPQRVSVSLKSLGQCRPFLLVDGPGVSDGLSPPIGWFSARYKTLSLENSLYRGLSRTRLPHFRLRMLSRMEEIAIILI